MKNTVCIDFDGVIHSYTSKWVCETHIPDVPVQGAFLFIEELLDNGYQVAINSTRCKTEGGRAAMAEWFNDHNFNHTTHLVFSEHKPPAILYIDDRGYCFSGQWPTVDFIKNFKPWNKK